MPADVDAERRKVLPLAAVEARATELIVAYGRGGDGCLSAAQVEELVDLLRDALHHIGTLSANVAMHPNGRCGCAGEGRCQWCLLIAAQERVETLREALQCIAAHPDSGVDMAEFPSIARDALKEVADDQR